MVGRDWLTRAHNLLGFKTDDGRREDALRHFIALLYCIRTVLLLDYSDRTQDARPNSPGPTKLGLGMEIWQHLLPTKVRADS
jgi:hypothetical protein